MPIAGDTHICEYLPWLTNAQRQPWSRFSVRLYHWDRAAAERDELWQRINAMVRGDEPIDVLRDSISEGVHEIITGVAGDRNCFMEAVNVPNRGLIGNLPQDTIVEVPGMANLDGVNGIAMGELPPLVAELCRREAALVEVLVQAGVEGDRDAALQALLLDPHVDDIELAKDVLKTYLDAFAEWLPQFHGRWQWSI
jgi:alpha-galactosidase